MGVPIVIAGTASAFFVVCANAWMNQPRGFTLRDGKVVHVDPWAAMLSPASPPQTVHMILAAFMVSSFLTASVYAVALLRGRRDAYHKAGFAISFTVGAVVAPFQIVVGDWAARFLADYQSVKLAAIEGVYATADNHAYRRTERGGLLSSPGQSQLSERGEPIRGQLGTPRFCVRQPYPYCYRARS